MRFNDLQDADYSSWIQQLHSGREARLAQLTELAREERNPLTPHRLIAELRDRLPEDAVCILDGATIMAAGQQLLLANQPVSRFTPGSNGCLGVGIPYAVGVKLQYPNRSVVAICGDMAVGLSLMDIETAVRYRVPIIVVIANKQGLFGKNKQAKYFSAQDSQPVATFLPDIRYDLICQALGGHGEYVETIDQFKGAWERAVASAKPACINVLVEPHAPYPGRD